MFRFPWQKLRERRERFRLSRKIVCQTDSEFISIAAPDVSKSREEWVVVVRQLIAELCGLSREELHAEDPAVEAQKLLGPATAKDFFLEVALEIVQEMDSYEFYQALRTRALSQARQGLQFDLTDEFGKSATRQWTRSRTIGEWIAWLAAELETRLGSVSRADSINEGNNDRRRK